MRSRPDSGRPRVDLGMGKRPGSACKVLQISLGSKHPKNIAALGRYLGDTAPCPLLLYALWGFILGPGALTFHMKTEDTHHNSAVASSLKLLDEGASSLK